MAVWTGAFYIVTVRLFPEKYHQISWKLEGTRLCVSRYSIAVKFGMCLSSIAAEAPARFHSNMILLNAKHRGCHSSRYLLIKSHFGSWINSEWIPWIMVIQFHSIKQCYGSSNSCSCINWCNLHLTHLGLVSHICVTKYSPHFPSDAYMRRKFLYFSYRSRGRPTKQCQAKMS